MQRSSVALAFPAFSPAPLLLALFFVLIPEQASGQASARPGPVDAATIDSGNTAWMLTSTALVLLMTLPGLALFYAGMVRRKNALATMAHSFAAACVATLVWIVIGYSLAFTPGSPFLGGLDRLMLEGLGTSAANGTVTVHPLAPTIPESVFMMFQMTFAIITLALITVILGPRAGFGREAMPPHNLLLTVVGASLLWVGWFGFNAGSAGAADGRAGYAMLVTQAATAIGALSWMAVEWRNAASLRCWAWFPVQSLAWLPLRRQPALSA